MSIAPLTVASPASNARMPPVVPFHAGAVSVAPEGRFTDVYSCTMTTCAPLVNEVVSAAVSVSEPDATEAIVARW